MRALPSPSSLAYPLSAAPSLPPPTAQSVGSPSTSYQPAVSIHTTPTNSVTSAHIANLQHQVTLKSLALQTLQSEYASLLQKLQRERVKSQTIEKKTGVADQEINELTSKNEELAGQMKYLESQLEESEQKREAEHSEAAKEKEQWGRMLDMDARLHAKNAEEKRKLRDERNHLAQRVAAYEEENTVRYEQIRKDLGSRMDAPQESEDSDRRVSPESASDSDLVSAGTIDSTSEVARLKREVVLFKARNEILRTSLEETRRHNQDLDERVHGVIQRSGEIGSVIDKALEDEQSASKTKRVETKLPHKPGSGRSTPGQPKSYSSPKVLPTVHISNERVMSKSPHPLEIQTVPKSTASSTASSMTMASIARAVSPGPAELGFHVTPSTSSPEELIKALGPVPAPMPAFQFGSTPFTQVSGTGRWDSGGRSNQQRKRSAGSVTPWYAPEQREANDKPESGRFRPLSHHVPSPYTSLYRAVAHAETSPHSYHSSPGPLPDDSSSNSGSLSGQSPDDSGDGTGSYQAATATPTTDLLPQQAGDSEKVMPPPSRPAV